MHQGKSGLYFRCSWKKFISTYICKLFKKIVSIYGYAYSCIVINIQWIIYILYSDSVITLIWPKNADIDDRGIYSARCEKYFSNYLCVCWTLMYRTSSSATQYTMECFKFHWFVAMHCAHIKMRYSTQRNLALNFIVICGKTLQSHYLTLLMRDIYR